MSEKPLLYEKQGKIGKIILNRPKSLNAINEEMSTSFGEMMRMADADPDTNVIVLCAAGTKAFCAGFDLKESIESPIVDVPARRENSLQIWRRWRSS